MQSPNSYPNTTTHTADWKEPKEFCRRYFLRWAEVGPPFSFRLLNSWARCKWPFPPAWMLVSLLAGWGLCCDLACWVSSPSGPRSAPRPMLSPLKSNLVKMTWLNLVLGFLLGLCAEAVHFASGYLRPQVRRTAVVSSMISWDCCEPSGWNYVCLLGKLKAPCHFFEIFSSGNYKYQYLGKSSQMYNLGMLNMHSQSM